MDGHSWMDERSWVVDNVHGWLWATWVCTPVIWSSRSPKAGYLSQSENGSLVCFWQRLSSTSHQLGEGIITHTGCQSQEPWPSYLTFYMITPTHGQSQYPPRLHTSGPSSSSLLLLGINSSHRLCRPEAVVSYSPSSLLPFSIHFAYYSQNELPQTESPSRHSLASNPSWRPTDGQRGNSPCDFSLCQVHGVGT